MAILIMGPMGAGKSSVACEIAHRRGATFADSDETIERDHGMDAAEIAQARGVSALHDLELAFATGAAEAGDELVAAVAASIADNPSVLRELVGKGSTLIYLDVLDSDVADLGGSGRHRRPIESKEAVALARTRRRNAINAGALVVSRRSDLASTVGAVEKQLITPQSSN